MVLEMFVKKLSIVVEINHHGKSSWSQHLFVDDVISQEKAAVCCKKIYLT